MPQPPYYSEYYPELISPSIKRVDKGVIEIRRFQDGRIRSVFWPFALIFLFICLQNGSFFRGGNIHWALFPERNIEAEYDYGEWENTKRAQRTYLNYETFEDREYQAYLSYSGEQNSYDTYRMWAVISKEANRKAYADYTAEYKRMSAIPINRQTFLREKLEENQDRRFNGMVDLLALIVFLLFAGFPKSRPVRLDIERRLVYFRWWGRFYIAQYPTSLSRTMRDMPNTENAFYRFTYTFALYRKEHWFRNAHGGSSIEKWLTLEIPCSNTQKKPCKVAIGSNVFKNHDPLANFLFHYVNHQFTDEELDDFLKQGRKNLLNLYKTQKTPLTLFAYCNLIFSNASLFPTWGYRGQATEKKIRKWPEQQNG